MGSHLKTIFLTLSIVLFTQCAHLEDPFLKVHPGMDKAEVTQILGTPADRSFSDAEEGWTYRRMDYNAGKQRVKIVYFRNGKVTSLKTDELAEQRHHEIERAKAGATNVNIGVAHGHGGSVVFPGKSLKCTEHNVFGNYPAGGGCNTFGCYPPGGSCNAFGCASQGQCGATACPHKIPSYHCP